LLENVYLAAVAVVAVALVADFGWWKYKISKDCRMSHTGSSLFLGSVVLKDAEPVRVQRNLSLFRVRTGGKPQHSRGIAALLGFRQPNNL
jgi:hypothetical protein